MTDTPMRDFDLGDVLTITDGRLVSPRHMDGVYDILNYMTGDSIYTHQIPRAMRVCAPALLGQHPQLRDVRLGDDVQRDSIPSWLRAQKMQFGETLRVAPLASLSWMQIDPVLEAQAIIGKDRVVTVDPHG